MPIAGTAVMRAADAMLRAMGGDQVTLVLPMPTAAADSSFQLGLSDPGVQQFPISPVIVRSLPTPASGPSRRLEFTLSATAVNDAVQSMGAESPDALFDGALGLEYQSILLHIESSRTDYFGGMAYLYHLIAVE